VSRDHAVSSRAERLRSGGRGTSKRSRSGRTNGLADWRHGSERDARAKRSCVEVVVGRGGGSGCGPRGTMADRYVSDSCGQCSAGAGDAKACARRRMGRQCLLFKTGRLVAPLRVQCFPVPCCIRTTLAKRKRYTRRSVYLKHALPPLISLSASDAELQGRTRQAQQIAKYGMTASHLGASVAKAPADHPTPTPGNPLLPWAQPPNSRPQPWYRLQQVRL